MVFDEEAGIAYEGYNADLSRAILILRYYTDLDLTPYDTQQGRYEIYDILATHGLWPQILDIVEMDLADVEEIARKLETAARRSFERKHALDYRLGRTLEGLLGTEPLAESIARAEGLNSKLIDLLGAVQSAPAVPGVSLAKKEAPDLHGHG